MEEKDFNPNDLAQVIERMAESMRGAFEMLTNSQADLAQLRQAFTPAPQTPQDTEQPVQEEVQHQEMELATEAPVDFPSPEAVEQPAPDEMESIELPAPMAPQVEFDEPPALDDATVQSIPMPPHDEVVAPPFQEFEPFEPDTNLTGQLGTEADQFLPLLNEEFEDPESMAGTSYLQNRTERRFRENSVQATEELTRLAIDHDYRIERVVDALRSRR